jgi:hypothetical protein
MGDGLKEPNFVRGSISLDSTLKKYRTCYTV